MWRPSKVIDAFQRNLKGDSQTPLRNYAGAGTNEGNQISHWEIINKLKIDLKSMSNQCQINGRSTYVNGSSVVSQCQINVKLI